ncbi:endonuclease/exonuclease/phosphatase family protein [Halocynthiibacter styelae]|uniref:Endonuclease n=1 Tax=Halocynthiibacter styelae TaxID=2761955 RepID=A0A8J7IW54_9RHOB|nr:endonuclease/exonuclease/phosphatase family protein [Paenihalocynthiibacter styelae]MBI1493848.1 endonuclease [Paenihalocynthiibacter styelae]
MKLFETASCTALPAVPAELHDRILAAPRNSETHRELMEQMEAMHLLEERWPSAASPLPAEFTVAAWNLERCLDPEGSTALLKQHKPDIILLSEMDAGMARTAQRNTTADLAREMGMGYAYGVEFHEMDLGGETEREFCKDDYNAFGWHGNALLSRTKPLKTALVRLDDHGHWFCPETSDDPAQPRVGGRMAVMAVIPTRGGDICAISTHLESATDAPHRQSQMDRLIAAADAFAPGLPVIIGGDLNTGNHLPNADWQLETLFDSAKRQGFSWGNNLEGMTTRKSRITRWPTRAMKLDWFACRGLKEHGADIIPALDLTKTPLSDHELIVGQFSI